MKYGLIGEKLPHSFSKIIHAKIAEYDYELKELKRSELKDFMLAADFCAINVTIPYKREVMKYLDEISPSAKEIGAVNTVVNKNGKLFGYNTDYLGLKALIEKNSVSLENKTVLILGSGGTSLTALAVCKDMGAKMVKRVSRNKKEVCITYGELEQFYTSEVIINTTPVGMYPETDNSPLDLSPFKNLEAVFDVIYNPLRTELVLSARELGVKSEGGLYMLVAQAVYASEYFSDKKYDADIIDKTYYSILAECENIVLSGMPGSGKSTVGKILATDLNKSFKDTDEEITKAYNLAITAIFEKYGETYFRDIESEVIKKTAQTPSGCVISLGGGAVLREENVKRLKKNGRIYFLNRPIEDIVPTDDRPLASDRQAIEKRFKERYDIYLNTCDCQIKVDNTAENIAEKIRKDYCHEIKN